MVAGYSDRRLDLTPRMRDVLAAAAAGDTVAQTAARLYLSESSVYTVRAALCARLGAPNVTAAVAVALRRGVLN